MKIGFYTDTYFPQVSGVSSSIETLRQELVKRGHQVYIFTTTDPKANKDEGGIYRFPSIPFASFPDRRITYSGLGKAIQLASELGLDIVHSHTEFSLGLIAYATAKTLRVPHIHTYHTMYENYTHYIMNGHLINEKHVKVLSRFFCQRTDGVIAPSEMTRKTLRSYKINRPIRVIPTGVEIYDYDPKTRQSTRYNLGYQDDEFVFLSLSRLSKEKGIQYIVEAFPDIIKLLPEARLLIVGDGPYRKDLQKQVNSLNIADYVQFTGQIDSQDVWKYYQASDVFINASRSESQGLTYLEALANHLPVIAPYNDYLAEIITSSSLGRLYEWGEDLAQVAKDYVDLLQDKPSSIEMNDLVGISSEEFGRKIEDFYLDLKKAKS